MKRKIGSGLIINRPTQSAPRIIWALLLSVTLFCPYVALAVEVECDPGSPTFTSPAQDLCVPAIASNAPLNINAFDPEWTTNTFFDHGWLGVAKMARVRVSRRATGINKSDLLLFFEVTGDSVGTGLDEIRIGLNPGTTSANNTLIKIHAFPTAGPPPIKERFTYDSVAGSWSAPIPNEPWYEVATRETTIDSKWFAEVRIPLNDIPGNPITGAGFRLYLEVLADDSSGLDIFQWPGQPNFFGMHDFICSDAERWHPMSFGTNCHPDLNIANGLYSCGDVYVLRGGVKSTEIALNQMNEFHADVHNSDLTKSATGAQVYLTLSSLGIGTPPQAMNYNHTDAAITAFFNAHFGSWMNAGASLLTGTPKPPSSFTVNFNSTDPAARFNWQPSLEPGTPADFVGHRCTGAFVDFKDDPNFANNFSYCNTSIVTCPTGEICPMSFSIGQVFPQRRPQENGVMRMVVTAINEPFPGWFNQGRFNLEGGGLKRVNERVFEAAVPAKGEVPVKLSFTPPRGRVEPTPSPKYPGPSPQPTRTVRTGERAHAAAEPQKGSDPIKDRDRLKEIYGDRPLIVIEGHVPAGFETGLDGKSKVQLYVPVSYVAFVVDTKAPGATPTPPVKPKKGCGKSSGRSFALFSLVALLGVAFTWRRARRRTKTGKTTKNV